MQYSFVVLEYKQQNSINQTNHSNCVYRHYICMAKVKNNNSSLYFGFHKHIHNEE